MKDLIDNSEINDVLEKLEGLEDEALAVSLLKEFNDATRKHGQLLMNKEQALNHDEWKKECDEAQAEVARIINQINDL